MIGLSGGHPSLFETGYRPQQTNGGIGYGLKQADPKSHRIMHKVRDAILALDRDDAVRRAYVRHGWMGLHSPGRVKPPSQVRR